MVSKHLIETFFLQTVDLVNTVTKAQIDNK